ncbi:MAG: helix-turn-helix transcriptional regulator [Candidatus Thorarchaeota archaeon]|nr:helix-turn-helix transcriptional regulator [Candidatus Thorarchaeota archaeon]
MANNQDFEALKKEVSDLKKTVYGLKNTIVELTNQLEASDGKSPYDGGQYSIFPNRANCLEGDVSWDRLLNLLSDADRGLTATELAEKWGRSRSRTSEVLNKLAEDGQIVKYRDGRLIRFRTPEE